MSDSRLHKSLLNAKIGLFFYFLTLIFSFFSRKIFLDCLGADFIGLTGTLQNILGILNLAELGIGTCISFFLFKPIQERNKDKIMEIMSIFGYLYRKIGIIIGIGGVIASISFPFIFRNTIFNMGIIYFTFASYLGSSLIGYFINYREILLSADQKNYVVSAYFQTAGIIKTIVQIALAYTYKNLYLWVAIEFLFGIIACVILNWKIDKEYPWLKTNKNEGKILLKKHPEILINTKQVFVHQIKDFLLSKSDEIMIFAFVSLKMVAFYGNYAMIINKLITMINTTLDGVNAGVGNLVAEGNKKNTIKVFWELMSIRYFIAGTVVFSLFQLMDPFVTLWLGEKYQLDHIILILLLVNLFIMQTRGAVDIFNHAHGLYADTWSAWAEGIINITVTVAAATQWGIWGILLGKIISICFIIVLWKPYYLFTKGLKVPVKVYWAGTIRYYITFITSFTVMTIAAKFLPFHPKESIQQFLLYGACTVIPFTLFYFIILLVSTPGMMDAIKRVPIFYKIFK
ncbi:Membrane protein involved in the export of O-antigen and teichoic acid [Bacteroides luti]|uniref:Membrane protein involved in the export of O-antigen and teichoic acid n=1 Tax=Bacteroides luti TaxID=1297750 RepID=A0A1M5BFL2_9BACE|nr:sugar transporter [Bacteroides luti]SHF41304.1 Membrane protein involved in the export of O-antigen and teichoic acid [Bacteroides luti]